MAHISPDGRLRVRTVSLDGLISQGEVPTPQYIKVDVEGAEMLVLLGAKSLLADARPTLFLATHGYDTHKQCCAFLESLGYHLQPIAGKGVDEANEILAYW